jgi:hypothetical protein
MSPLLFGGLVLGHEVVGKLLDAALISGQDAVYRGHHFSYAYRLLRFYPVRQSDAIGGRPSTDCADTASHVGSGVVKRRVVMDLEQVKRAVEQAAKNGVLTCHDARALAEQLRVEYALVGQACNEAGIKVWSCELGCF